MTSDKLRLLPAVHEVVEELRQHYHSNSDERLTRAARDAINAVRAEVLQAPQTPIDRDIILQMALATLQATFAPIEVINATGVILHTNLGRAPLSPKALEAIGGAAQSSDLEYDLQHGKRASRNRLLSEPLAELTHTEAGFIVNNCAAALVLALAALGGKATALARSQIIEIGGGFRLPDIMKASGVELYEVGTTNRTRLTDYEEALENGAEAILWMHRSNFEITGFTEEPTLDALRALADKYNVPLIYDLGTGLAWDTATFDLKSEPTIHHKSVHSADVTLFSGDKLFGGPQAGVIVGRRASVDRLAKHPLARALRADKLTIAAFAATLSSHLENRPEEIPVFQMLNMAPEELQSRAQAIAASLPENRFRIVEVKDTVGGGTMPNSELLGLAIEIKESDSERVHELLRSAPHPIVTRIQDNAVLIHVRTLLPNQLTTVAGKLANTLALLS